MGRDLFGHQSAIRAGALVRFAVCLRRLPVVGRSRLEQAEVRPLFVYGGWVTVSSSAGPLLKAMNRVLIGSISGARAVTAYYVPFGVVSQISILPGSRTSALFPRFSAQATDAERR